jgi:hypothetical protein
MMQKTEKSLLLPGFKTRFRGPYNSSTYDTDATSTSVTVLEMVPRWERTADTLKSSPGLWLSRPAPGFFRL